MSISQTSTVRLNLKNPEYATVYAAQNDSLSRHITAQLYDGATPWVIPNGALVTIRYRKPDGRAGFYDTDENGNSAYSVSGSNISFVLAQQALNVPGDVLLSLDFFAATGEQLSTFTMTVQVQKGALPDSDIISSNYFNVLTATLTTIAGYVNLIRSAFGAPRTAATIAAMTDTSFIYVYTGSETGYTFGNWYFWDGTAWTSGGVYNSTAFVSDTTLSIPGAAADAKTVGNLIYEGRTAANVTPKILMLLKPAAVSALESAIDMPVNTFFYANGSTIQALAGDGLTDTLLTTITYSLTKLTGAYADSFIYVITRYNGQNEWRGVQLSDSTSIMWYRVDMTDRMSNVETTATTANNTSENLKDINSFDLLRASGTFTSTTSNGITYTWDATTRAFNVNGTTASTGFCTLWASSNGMLPGTHAGDRVWIAYNSEDTSINIAFYFYAVGSDSYTLVRRQKSGYIQIPADCEKFTVRLTVIGTTISNKKISVGILTAPPDSVLSDLIERRNTIKILAIGNSFTYSTLGYVPEILKIVAPNIDLTFGIIYDSGFAIDQHVDYFNNDTAHTEVDIYTSSTGKFTRHISSLTTKQVLSGWKWDYIVLQEKPNRVYNTVENVTEVSGQPGTYHTRLVQFCDLIAEYVSGLDDPYSFSFLYNISQAYGANDPDLSVYSGANNEEKSDNMALMHGQFAEMLMTETPYMAYILDVLPTGTAVQNARQISAFKALGEDGYLCVDTMSHLQSGIGVLIAGYAAAYKLLELIGEPVKTFSVPFYPTDAWQLDYYGRSLHGNCVGISTSNCLTGQKCAVSAIKYPYEIK